MISKSKDTLLLVGDASSDRANLRATFEAAYNLLEAENTAQAAMLLEQNRGRVAAVLADIPPSDGDGLRALASASHTGAEDAIPILVFTSPMETGELEEYAFLLGASDVVKKPYTTLTIQRRVQILVDLYRHKQALDSMAEAQRKTIRDANQAVIDTLVTMIEQRNVDSGNHVQRVRRFVQVLLKEVARCCPEYGLNDDSVEQISGASSLHDIGKLGIPDAILKKTEPLTAVEFEILKNHTTIGGHLVERLQGMRNLEFLRYAFNICLYHHERWDGRGYPNGLRGDEIPICAQVVGLADSFDSLTSKRVYRKTVSSEVALNMILNGECGAFSPKLLECFKHVQRELAKLSHQYADGYVQRSDDVRAPLPAPVWTPQALDSLHLSQLKYQALLHYLNDTVIELDIDNRLYHVVYNPDPDLDTLLAGASFDTLTERLLNDGTYPVDPQRTEALKRRFDTLLFQQNVRKSTFQRQVFRPLQGEYTPYDVTVLRVDTENNAQRLLIAIFHKQENSQNTAVPERENLPAAHVLYTLTCCVLRCDMDTTLTIGIGAKNLFFLTGYRPEEVESLFQNSLLNMVVSEDRLTLASMMQEAARRGSKAEAEFRVVHKDGPPVWVLCKTRLYVESNGREYFYLTLSDISFVKERQERMEQDILRDHTLIDQLDGVVYEWDLVHHTETYSDNWEKRLGYPPTSPSVIAQRGVSATRVHPDDLPQLQAAVMSLQGDGRTANLDLRIADKDGKYVWNNIRAAKQFDSNGKATRIICLITDIDELKEAAISMKEQAERDALTKLFNKVSTQRLVSEYLAARDPHEHASILILDLDNFKTVNDSYGHMYGDALLTQVSTTLRKLFRAQDVVGRIGGDEFMVLLKDIPNLDVLHTRCDLLLQAFREMLSKLMPDLKVSCSVGCALIPEHGVTYADLYSRADEALYTAKLAGKNQYKVYDPKSQNVLTGVPRVTRSTRVDSDNELSVTDDAFARFAFHRLYTSCDIDATIDELLAFIGARFNVSRVYIFEDSPDGSACSNTFEWCNAGISPEKDGLQNLSYTTDLPGWKELYDERGVFYCPDVSVLSAPLRAVLEPQEIKSMLQCAIMDGDTFRGFVGFDECSANRLWTQGQIDLLDFLAEVLAVFLLKQRSRQRPPDLAQPPPWEAQ